MPLAVGVVDLGDDAAPCTISLPTSVEPVKATLSTSLCADSAAPAVSPRPGTILTTPSGIRAPAMSPAWRYLVDLDGYAAPGEQCRCPGGNQPRALRPAVDERVQLTAEITPDPPVRAHLRQPPDQRLKLRPGQQLMPGDSTGWQQKPVQHRADYGIEQTTVTGRAGLPRVTRNCAVAAQIIRPDCISGLRPVTR